MRWAAAIAVLIVALAWIFARVGDRGSGGNSAVRSHASSAAQTASEAVGLARPRTPESSLVRPGVEPRSPDARPPHRAPAKARPIVIGNTRFVRGESLALPPKIDTLIAEFYLGLDDALLHSASEEQREQLEELCQYAKTRIELLHTRRSRKWAQAAFEEVGPPRLQERKIQIRIRPGDDPELDRATERLWLETQRSLARLEAFAAGLEASE